MRRNARQKARLRALREVYERLPRLDCKGLCGHSCGPIGMSPAEYERFCDRLGREPRERVTYKNDGATMLTATWCPALTAVGRCRIYSDRPMVCRLWGVVESMPCPYGCLPEGGLLSDVDGMALLGDAMVAGGAVLVDGETFRQRVAEDPSLLELGRRWTRDGMAAEERRAGLR